MRYKNKRMTSIESFELRRLNMTKLRTGETWFYKGRYFTLESLKLTNEGLSWEAMMHECETHDKVLPGKRVTILERVLRDGGKKSNVITCNLQIDLRISDTI